MDKRAFQFKVYVGLWFTLLIYTTSHSQSNYHKVNLNQITSPIRVNFLCSKVVDKRIVNENIGFVQKGLSNRIVKAKLDGNFEEVLKGHANQLLRADQEYEEIVLLIHELTISERTSAMSEKGICRMEVEFVRLIDSIYYSLGSYSSEIKEGGIDVTKSHNNRISACLRNCLLEFSNSNWMKRVDPEPIDLNDTIPQYNYNEIPKEGLYSSFNKMGRNEPMVKFEKELVELNVDSKVERYKLNILDDNYKKRRVMFISENGNLYIHASLYSQKKHFIKAKHIGRYIYFEDRFSDINSMVAFGLIGAIASREIKGLILDTSTGQVSLLTERKLFFMIRDQKGILQEYRKSKRKDKDRELALMKLNENYD
jgi:hypothetical protein